MTTAICCGGSRGGPPDARRSRWSILWGASELSSAFTVGWRDREMKLSDELENP
jgi:hypothetical protein